MSKIRTRALAAALAAAGAGAAIAAAAPAAAPAEGTISFTEHNISDHSFNLGSGHGFAVGSVELIANNLMQGSTRIGHDGGNCTVTRLSGGTADELCTTVVVLAHGQIDMGGLVTSTPKGPTPFPVAVTGGTGSYQNARGYATVVPGPAPKITIHLTS